MHAEPAPGVLCKERGQRGRLIAEERRPRVFNGVGFLTEVLEIEEDDGDSLLSRRLTRDTAGSVRFRLRESGLHIVSSRRDCGGGDRS